MGGNLQAYARFLEDRYGYGILQELETKKRNITKYFPYLEEIEKRKAQLKKYEISE